MSDYKLTREEQETVIRSSAADSEWDVLSADPRFIRYLKRQGYGPETDCQASGYVSCKIPFRRLRIAKRQDLTDEQKARMARRFKTAPRNWAVPRDKPHVEANRSGGVNSALETINS